MCSAHAAALLTRQGSSFLFEIARQPNQNTMTHSAKWSHGSILTLLLVACGFGCTGSAPSTGAGGTSARALGGSSALVTGTGGFQIGGAPSAGGTGTSSSAAGGASATGAWSMGYYASWQANQYPVSEIEWSGLTHIAMAFYTPASDSSLSLMGGDAQLPIDLVAAAHQHGVKAIASLGGADSAPAFRQVTAAGNIQKFIDSLVTLMQTFGYDGLDVDWEPLEQADEPVVIDLAKRLRQARPSAVLTIPVGYLNANFAADLTNYPAISAVYDQVNLMTYGMAGAWQGWKSWHSSPLFHEDSATPTSIDSSVRLYVDAGVPKSKLGVGIGFYGLCYSPPVTGPDQALNGATLVAGDGTISYASIVQNYYSTAARRWDSVARAPYLSFASAQSPDGCSYISYDDEQSIAEKASYLKANGLGGVIQWEINEGYIASAPPGARNPLLSAIASELLR